MNVLFMTLLYPQETIDEAAKYSRDGLQNQINSYQRALVKGIDECLETPERLDIVNALPVGAFPRHYRKLFLRGGIKDNRIQELSCLNLPWFKQKGRERRAERAILSWARQNKENRTLLIYTLYLPYLTAVAKAKKKISDLKAVAIVTDLPNEWGLSSGRKGVLKRIEHSRGMAQLQACQALDGYVLITAPMAEVLPQKPSMVMEGLILTDTALPNSPAQPQPPVVLYSGTLNRELGIDVLLEAFQAMPDYELWLCGCGDMAAHAQSVAQSHHNIKYFGFIPQDEALRLQAAATVLINPRSSAGLFTRYSFPSKTLEYMRSGKPVLCYRLEGIPDDYGAYLTYINGEGPEAICKAVRALIGMDASAREALGQAGRRYVCEQKNPKVQCARILQFLRSLA